MTTESYPIDAFEKIYRVEQKHFWFKSRNMLIADSIKKYCVTAKNFFEIGCGTGHLLTYLSTKFPYMLFSGCDLYDEGLSFAKKSLPHIDLYKMDAKNLSYNEEFDLVGAFDILEHIADDETVLHEVYKALKPQGRIILTVPQYRFLWSQTDEYAHHVRRYTKKEITTKLQLAGFKINRVTSFVTILFPLLVLSRLRYKVFKQRQQLVEFELPVLLNNFFYLIQRIELFLIKKFPLPIGGSLLVIAEK